MAKPSIETQVCDRLYVLRRYIFSRFNFNEEESEDVYGDTVLKIFQAIRKGNFKKEYPVDTYMRNCVWSVVIDRYRREGNSKRIRTSEHDYYFKTFIKSHEKKYEYSGEIKIFLERLECLTDICKKILMLLLFQGMSHDEIAETLDMPRGTISVHIHRMRKELGNIDLSKTRIRENIQMEK